MLQMGFSQANITAAAQPAAPDRLLAGAFNTGTRGILLVELSSRLVRSCRLYGFVLLASL
jgi:hypothetical protein